MKVEKLRSGVYEAVTKVNGFSVELSDGIKIPMEIAGYGENFTEAITRCLNKVSVLLYPHRRSEEEAITEVDKIEEVWD